MDRKAFLDQEAPAGYVAGIGRGATGFTTSADVGGASRIVPDYDSDNENDTNGVDEKGILAGSGHADDDEADKIYEEVERRLAGKKSATETVMIEPTVSNFTNSFTDLKRALSTVSANEWENLPEVGDLTKRNKRLRLLEKLQQRFYAVPDSMLGGGGGIGSTETKTDFQSISHSKDKLLSQQLDQVIGVTTSSTADSDVLAGDLIASENLDSQIEDLKKGRLILASLRRTDPLNSHSWIASARLEEQAKKISVAKSMIEQACSKIPKNEAVWIERIRLNQAEGTQKCKIICADALKFNPKSEQLWLQAVKLEHSSDYNSQRRILMRALESLPSNVTIWKSLIDMEDKSNSDGVKKLLTKAVELCPKEWDLWISLINLSPYDEAKALINRARKSMNDNYKVWITAIKLEERENTSITDPLKLVKVLTKGIQELKKHTAEDKLLTRSDWLKEASIAEMEDFPFSCQAIVSVILETEETPLNTLLSEAEIWKHFKETTNSIFQYIVSKYPKNVEVWFKLFDSLLANEQHILFKYYKQAIQLNPENELFYLMFAKALWKNALDIEQASKVLVEANQKFPESEQIWFARIKLSQYTSSPWVAPTLKISKLMVEKLPNISATVWYKHIHIMRCDEASSVEDLVQVSDLALEKFPDCDKLYIQKSQILSTSAAEILSVGVRQCPKSVKLWCTYADSVSSTNPVRARAIFDNAIIQNPDSPELWVKRIRFEKALDNIDSARQLCTRALQRFPSDPYLWIENLFIIPKMSQRKNSFVDALKRTNNSPVILLNIGLFFWIDGKFQKVKSWFDRALEGGKNNGDFWGWIYKYLYTYGSKEEIESFVKKFEVAYDDINEGEVWNKLAKSVGRENFNDSIGLLSQVSTELVRSTPQLQVKG